MSEMTVYSKQKTLIRFIEIANTLNQNYSRLYKLVKIYFI